MESVGLRELRQNASGVIRRVEQTGIEIEVTVQGRPVALITPLVGAHRRLRSIRTELLKSALSELGSGDADWATEIHASREDDTVTDPWSKATDKKQ
jgi:prevent-host-death family protein